MRRLLVATVALSACGDGGLREACEHDCAQTHACAFELDVSPGNLTVDQCVDNCVDINHNMSTEEWAIENYTACGHLVSCAWLECLAGRPRPPGYQSERY